MKEKFEALRDSAIAAYGDDPDCRDILDIIQRALSAFLRYVEAVDTLEIYRLIQAQADDPETVRSTTQQLDLQRHNAHEAAIASCKAVNRLCAALGTAPICPETDNRVEIGNFCCAVAADLFAKRVL